MQVLTVLVSTVPESGAEEGDACKANKCCAGQQ